MTTEEPISRSASPSPSSLGPYSFLDLRDLSGFIPVYRTMANGNWTSALHPVLLLVVACNGPQQEAARGPEAPPPTGVNLALLPPSGDTLMAALEGVLHAEGRCLYIVGDDPKRNRTLPAFHIADIKWDEASRTLRVRDKVFVSGQRVVLGGGQVANPAALDWVQRPDPSCDASDLFMAGTIDPAEAGPGH